MRHRIAAGLLAAVIGMAAQADDNPWVRAVNAYNSGDFATAAREFRPFAEAGQQVAQYILGWIYQNGEGVPQDFAEAAKWYRKAADKGHADAQHALGLAYLAGEGVARDPAEAARWLRKAADQNKPGAQYLMGYLLARGEGVERNEAAAAEWYRKAALQGAMDAQYALGLALSRGNGVEKDDVEANQWLGKAAAQGQIDAAYLFGWHHEKGIGMLPDYAEAAKWFSVASEGNHAAAHYHLATLLRDGRGVDKDEPRALALFKRAAAAGHADVPVAIDEFVQNGRLDTASELAAAWLQKFPEDVQMLTSLAFAALGEAKSDPGRFSASAKTYAEQAIALIEADRRPGTMADTDWAEYRTRWLPQLHMRLGSMALKSGAPAEARKRLERATALDPADPYGWYLLGQLGYGEYEQLNNAAKSLQGAEKDQAIGQAFAKLDEVIDAYARALGLAERQDSAKALREPLLQDLTGIYEFRHGSRAGLDAELAKYRAQ